MNSVNKSLSFENSRLVLINSTLTLKNENISVRLSALENKFLGCLIMGMTEREEIIQMMWPAAHWKAKGNNYNQLVFQTRTTLKRGGCPEDTLILSPGKGISINVNLLKPLGQAFDAEIFPLNDQGLMFIR
ncbi:hypothetical protein [Serratia quinivorans]|uniref:hypothetical protein n=1 Tax=Serratia quinivorans TaxID=137545 RepID=UPI0021772858|nr:hypothetical protein [Serratia quinivorans]CAI1958901.1 Uncharacterised protein [Serratia quinivorans]CAI2160707.1 Uncharacterised protein [Serratia quinivorans]